MLVVSFFLSLAYDLWVTKIRNCFTEKLNWILHLRVTFLLSIVVSGIQQLSILIRHTIRVNSGRSDTLESVQNIFLLQHVLQSSETMARVLGFASAISAFFFRVVIDFFENFIPPVVGFWEILGVDGKNTVERAKYYCVENLQVKNVSEILKKYNRE